MQILKRLSHERLGMIGLVIVLIWAIVALLAPVIAPPAEGQSATMMLRPTFSAVPLPPSASSWFGTTGGGYDIFYGIVWGSRTAFVVALITVFSTALIGVTLGAVGAYLGGAADYLTMRLVDLFMSIPFIIAVIVMTVALGKGLDKIILALIVFGWPSYARVIRSEVLSVKQRDYVLAAKLAGASPWHILIRHVMPNSIYPIIVLMSINIGRIVLIAASMSFIGIGTEPGTPIGANCLIMPATGCLACRETRFATGIPIYILQSPCFLLCWGGPFLGIPSVTWRTHSSTW
jgi:peptide/nickel transport system permease protein